MTLRHYICIDNVRDGAHAAGVKTAQLQIRVTPAEKARLARAARRAGLGLSAYVLAKALSDRAGEWHSLGRDLAGPGNRRLALAALSAWLAKLGAGELHEAVQGPPPASLPEELANTVAAMVEHACAAALVRPPEWTRDVPPLAHPVFGSTLASLRLHLLANSPPAFRRRNLFVDTAVGGQV